jgi:hypothetical protein
MPQKRKDDVSRNKKQALQGKAKKRGGRHDDDSDSVDSHGNIRGLIDYEYDKIDQIRGMDISIVTTAQNQEEGLALLKEFGLPFKK